MGLHEYDVQLCPDTNTCRHMQWFYFRVAGMRPGTPYKLNIVNLCKRESLYNHGLRPLTYSEKRVLIHGQGPPSPIHVLVSACSRAHSRPPMASGTVAGSAVASPGPDRRRRYDRRLATALWRDSGRPWCGRLQEARRPVRWRDVQSRRAAGRARLPPRLLRAAGVTVRLSPPSPEARPGRPAR